ncbi:hypothetical protein [Roseovarius sp. D22-M7]|uniref:hypothetical protein n=1 Tax=Roseovarius sp. D22-M7 TaxID=3127116 RepID=UPI00301052A0
MTAVPDWMDQGRAILKDLGDRTFKEAQQQQEMFLRNVAVDSQCLKEEFIPVTVGDLKVDPVLCEATGDILVRYQTSTGDFRMVWVDIQQHVEKKVAASSRGAAFAGVPGGAAPARDADRDQPRMDRMDGVRTAQGSGKVVCVKQEDTRTLLRHVRDGSRCFDERIDTLTGWLKSRTPVPCRVRC